MWGRIGRQHLSAGQGCACGFGGLLLQASDFELAIVEFLINDARKADLPNVEPFIDAAARRGPDRYSLRALLDAIAAADVTSAASPVELDFALTRLRTSLTSIDAAHSRFTCD